MQIGSVYCGRESYGGSFHCLGLYRVVKLGSKFASLQKIECEWDGKPSQTVTPSDRSLDGFRRARLPLTKHPVGRPVLVAHDNYDPEEDAAICGTASMYYKSYKRVHPNAEGEYVYTSSSQHYG